MASEYHDMDGNPCSLETLCRREPAWAASRLRVELSEVARLRAEREHYRRRIARLLGVGITQVKIDAEWLVRLRVAKPAEGEDDA